MSMYEERIRKGIARLDQDRPRAEWLPRVQGQEINMWDVRYDVLGRIYGHYTQAKEHLNLSSEEMDACGFGLANGTYDEWYYLEREWEEALRGLSLEAEQETKNVEYL